MQCWLPLNFVAQRLRQEQPAVVPKCLKHIHIRVNAVGLGVVLQRQHGEIGALRAVHHQLRDSLPAVLLQVAAKGAARGSEPDASRSHAQ
jgi:hypothetical protein